MKHKNINLLITFCFITLTTACSSDPKIISATEDKVVINAPANNFTGAYDLAKKECEKNTRIAKYITDGTADLEEVAFSCIAPEIEEVAEADTATESTTETDTEEEPLIEEEEAALEDEENLEDLEMELAEPQIEEETPLETEMELEESEEIEE